MTNYLNLFIHNFDIIKKGAFQHGMLLNMVKYPKNEMNEKVYLSNRMNQILLMPLTKTL